MHLRDKITIQKQNKWMCDSKKLKLRINIIIMVKMTYLSNILFLIFLKKNYYIQKSKKIKKFWFLVNFSS